MATFEERLTAIEHGYADLKHDNEDLKHGNEDLKQKIELHTIAIGALVNKATLESLNEKHDKIFQALIAHDEFTNRQLSEFREKVEVQIEGKVAGLQTEMRQGFKAVEARFAAVDSRFEAVDRHFAVVDRRLDTIDSRLDGVDNRLNTIDNRLDTIDNRLDAQGQQLDKILLLLNTLTNKPG